jgi:TetR/AcrR family tetracycline transcriptional repressor
MVDEVGVDNFSVNQLGKRLGVSGPSIYYYFPDKEQLLTAVGLLALRDVRGPVRRSSDGWADWFLSDAVSFYQGLRRHPNVVGVLLARKTHPATLDLFEVALRGMEQSGIQPAYGLALVDAVEGIALSWVAFSQVRVPKRGFRAVDSTQHPTVAAGLSASMGDVKRFRETVRALIAGFQQLHCEEPAGEEVVRISSA